MPNNSGKTELRSFGFRYVTPRTYTPPTDATLDRLLAAIQAIMAGMAPPPHRSRRWLTRELLEFRRRRQAAYTQRWVAAHRGRVRAAAAAWRRLNPLRVRAYRTHYRTRHRRTRNAYQRRWWARHRVRWNALRRARAREQVLKRRPS